MRRKLLSMLAGLAAALAPAAFADIPRTADGRPDLSGVYDIATLTPLQRPEEFGDNLYLSPEEAEKAKDMADDLVKNLIEQDAQPSDPDRTAPPVGGDGSQGAAGNVGGYNAFWIDPGSDGFAIDGKYRTSIIHDPPNGQLPQLTPAGQANAMRVFSLFGENTGEAWWMKQERPFGPYDDPEIRPLGERCLLGFGSTSGPPMLPVLYNNLKRIVQTPDYVMILNEMVHHARIIRLNSEHGPDEVRQWNGDSIGWWDGDTLVVETKNFRDQSGLYMFGASKDLHVTERFRRVDADTLSYSFTVNDPTAWEQPWSGEYPWPATDTNVYEYACHEANYALGNILRGARLLEADYEASLGGE